MAEHWKSTPRFWCKQCKIYIRDTSFEKSQHEASGKHQGNLKRFLRDIHRENERQQRESQKAKNEVERLRQTVAGGSGSGSGTPLPGQRSTAAAAPPPRAERPVSMDERKRQMAQLAEMGVAIPEEFRRDMALAGDWQTTNVWVLREDDNNNNNWDKPSTSSTGIRKKRKLDGDDDGEEKQNDPEPERLVSKTWGQRMREYPGSQAEDEDLDVLLESTKSVKKVKTSTEGEGGTDREHANETPTKTENDDGAAKREDSDVVPAATPEAVKEEPSDAAAPAVKSESEEPTPGVVFKKRKPKAMRK